MSRNQLVFSLAAGLSMALACAGGPSSSFSRKSRTTESVGSAADYTALDQGYRVPPDRAALRIDVAVHAPSAAAASGQVRARITALRQAAGDACTVAVLDYQAPQPYDRDSLRSTAEVRVDIPLTDLADVGARMDALDTCLAALASTETDGDGVEDDEQHTWVLRTPQPLLMVDHPEQHIAALLERENAAMAAVAAGGAPQMHPEDMRCTPTGVVHHGDRRLSGIELILDVSCTIKPTPPPVPIAPVDTGSVY